MTLRESGLAILSMLAALAMLVGPARATELVLLPTKLDLWLFAQENDPATSRQWKWVWRAMQPVKFDSWLVELRADLPLLYTNKKGPANEDAQYHAHLGDVFGQVQLTTPRLGDRLDFNVGLRLQFPTGGASPFGKSQYMIAPHVGAGYVVPVAAGFEISIEPRLRYFHGFAPTREGIVTTRTLDLYPTVVFGLPDGWQLMFWHENPLIYDRRSREWFVPLDIMIAKRLSETLTLAVGAATRLAGREDSYRHMIYTRVGLVF